MIGQLRTHDRSFKLSESTAKMARCALACLLSLSLILLPNSAFALEQLSQENQQTSQASDGQSLSLDSIVDSQESNAQNEDAYGDSVQNEGVSLSSDGESSDEQLLTTMESDQESAASEDADNSISISPADEAAVNQMVAAWVERCNTSQGAYASQTAKARWMHDELVNYATYDPTRTGVGAEGVLIDRVGDSESFYLAYSRLLNEIGIKTRRVETTSESNNGEMAAQPFVWTAAELDGNDNWYHISTAADRKAYQEFLGSSSDSGRWNGISKNIFFAVPTSVMQSAFAYYDGSYVEADGRHGYFGGGKPDYEKCSFITLNPQDCYAYRLAQQYFTSTSGSFSVLHQLNSTKSFELNVVNDFEPASNKKLEPKIDYNSSIYDIVCYLMREKSVEYNAWSGRTLEVAYIPGGWNNNTMQMELPRLSFQATLNGVTIEGLPETGMVETGYPLTPQVTVKWGTQLLERGLDYDVEYSNNVSPGTATVTISPTPDVSGFVGGETRTFTIMHKPEVPEEPITFKDVVQEQNKKVQDMVDAGDLNDNQYDRAVFLYDYLINLLDYDDSSASSEELADPEYALENKKANSEGFCEALNLLYYDAGIEDTEIVEQDGWFWLRANIDGIWCNIDPAHAAKFYKKQSSVGNLEYLVTFSFGLTDDQMRVMHPDFVATPGTEANNETMNFFTNEGSKYNSIRIIADLRQTIANKFAQGEEEFYIYWPDGAGAEVYQIVYEALGAKLNNTAIGDAAAKVITNTKAKCYLVRNGDQIQLSADHIRISDITYTGVKATHEYSVWVGSKKLEKGKDYIVVQEPDRVDFGQGTITIRGTGVVNGEGRYIGEATKNYRVLKRPIVEANVFSIPTMAYTGSQLRPSPVIMFNGAKLVEGKDYVVDYGPNVTGNGTVTIYGLGNYSQNVVRTFAISHATLANAKVSAIPDQAYAPSGATPALTVYWEGRLLKAGVDYVASYSNNTSRGQANVTISGKGVMSGSLSRTFNIYTTSQNRPDVSGAWKKTSGKYWFSYDAKSKAAQRNRAFPTDEWVRIGGKVYHFDSKGYMHYGWQQLGGTWYYFGGKSDGALKYGWKKLSGKWYYFNSAGAMLTGFQSIGGKTYYFNGSGAMLTGWQKLSNTWYYFDGSGAMQTGWKKLGGKWYYFNGSGKMLTGFQSIGGKTYYFNGSGAMLTGWQKIAGKDYYFDGSGVMARNTWIGKYHVNADGVWDTSR